MTDVVAALGALARHPTAAAPRAAALDAFLLKWKDDNNVICTYLSLVASMAGGISRASTRPTLNLLLIFRASVYALVVLRFESSGWCAGPCPRVYVDNPLELVKQTMASPVYSMKAGGFFSTSTPPTLNRTSRVSTHV